MSGTRAESDTIHVCVCCVLVCGGSLGFYKRTSIRYDYSRLGTDLKRHHPKEVTQFRTGVRLSQLVSENRELTLAWTLPLDQLTSPINVTQ